MRSLARHPFYTSPCTMSKTPAAWDTAGYSGVFKDGNWWLFCFLILVLNYLLLAFDPVPKLFMGDSASYLWTAVSGWVPPDRSFLYGYVIRWSSLWTKSLTLLLLLQTFFGAVTAILVALVCRWIFALTARMSYLFGILCSLDPLQLVWQRYVMTETISLFSYVLMLLFSFLYLKERRLWQLAIVQALSVLVISFRMSYLLVVQLSALFLPLIAFLPEIRAMFRKRSTTWSKMLLAKSVGSHLALGILFMFVLHQGYRHLNGRLAGREPAYLHTSGLSILTTWAPILKPIDAPDPRFAKLISEGGQFRLNDISAREAQLYSPGHLAARWKTTEPRRSISEQVAKQTALHALLRNPMGVATLGAKTFLRYWDFNRLYRYAKRDLGKAENNWPKTRTWDLAAHFSLSPPRPGDAETYTLLQQYFLRSQLYYYVVLLSPLICSGLIFLVTEGYVFLLVFHSWILFGTITLLSKDVSVRYLQPMSLLTILIFAVFVKAVTDRRSQPKSVTGP
jgi:hypothetical protein